MEGGPSTIWAAIAAICGVVVTVVPLWYKITLDLAKAREEIEKKSAKKYRQVIANLGDMRRAEKACRLRVKRLVEKNIQNRLLIEELTTKCAIFEQEIARLNTMVAVAPNAGEGREAVSGG